MRRHTARRLIWLLSTIWCLVWPLAAQAQNAISQGYTLADQGVAPGALVSVAANDSQAITRASSQNGQNLVGVAGDNAALALGEGQAQTQVITAGTAAVLVSDVDGVVQAGDKIAPSLIAGVGAKAVAAGNIVGTAQGGMDLATAATQQITDQNGLRHTVHIAKVPVQIVVSYYAAPGSSFIPPALQGAADAIAGRPVSVLRVLAAAILVLTGLVSSSVILYIAVRSALNAIGRNPLATAQVRHGLWQIGVAVAAILVGTGTVSYFVIIL